MSTHQRFRPTVWDVLEGRVLPSGSGIVPLERFDAYAVARHQHNLEQARAGDADVVFLGDSITDNWGDAGRDGPGRSVWNERLGSFVAANFGVPGDTTANVLWRIGDGELAGKPRLVVLEIGTNDLAYGHSTAEAVAGIHAVIDAILDASPTSRILLMGILPRGSGVDDPLTREASTVNAQVSGWADGQHLGYLDIGAQFLNEDGTLDTSLFLDGLHPNARGYEIWAGALVPILSSGIFPHGPGESANANEPNGPPGGVPTQGNSTSSPVSQATGPNTEPVLVALPPDTQAGLWDVMAAANGHSSHKRPEPTH